MSDEMPKLGPRLIVLALTSLFIGGFLTWLYLQDPTTELPKPVVDPAPPETSEQKANAPRGSFQFYDLLVETEVPVEVEPEPDRPKDGRSVFLQVASFKDPKDAESTRVQLIMMNLTNPVIETRDGWHRLVVGPYNDDRKRFVAQDLLIKQGYEYLVLRR